MVKPNNKEKDVQVNENERLEEESLEQVAEAVLKTFKGKSKEAEQKFNEEADKIEQEFKKNLDKTEKKYVRQFIILVLSMLLVSICCMWFVRWYGTDGFTDYYRPFDDIKSMVEESIEEPFSLSLVFTTTSEAKVILDMERADNDTVIILEDTKWDLNGKKIYIKESVVESLIEKYEANKNSQ